MKKFFVVAAAGSLALLLTSCSEEATPQIVTVTETVTHSAAPSPSESSTAEESSAAPQPTESKETETPSPTTDPEEPGASATHGAAADLDFGETVTNSRGNLVKEIDQWAGMANESGDFMAVFRVTGIEVGVTCTNSYAEASQNGQFIALDFEVHTFPELAESEWDQIMITAHDFSVFDEDSKRENDSVGNSYSCMTESETLPQMIGPGEEVTGKLILDSGVTSGSIVLNGMGLGVGGAWAWNF